MARKNMHVNKNSKWVLTVFMQVGRSSSRVEILDEKKVINTKWWIGIKKIIMISIKRVILQSSIREELSGLKKYQSKDYC